MKNIFSHRSILKFALFFSSIALGDAQCEDSWDIPYSVNAEIDENVPTNRTSSQFSGYHAPGQIIFPIESQSTTQKKTYKIPAQRSGVSQELAPKPQWHESKQQTVIEGNPTAPTAPTAPQSVSLKRVSAVPNQQNTPKISIEPKHIAQTEPVAQPTGDTEEKPNTILINFNNVSIIEYIRFISRLTSKNFVFDEADLQFNVTIISEEPATFENIMTALLQELRIHDLTLLEQGNNLIIHKNPRVNAVSQLVSDDISTTRPTSEIITQVFRLNTAEADKVAAVIRPLTSQYALVEVLSETNHLIITDLATNVAQIGKLIKSVDSPSSGLVIGQYVVRTTSIETLIPIALKIMGPIAQEQPLTMVPWSASNSIFVVSTPYMVERTLSILQHIDQNQKATKIFDLKELKYSEEQLKGLEVRELPPGGLYINNLPYEYPIIPTEAERREGFPESGWQLDQQGNWILQFKESEPRIFDKTRPPLGTWQIDQQGVWYFKVFPKGGTERVEAEEEPEGPPPKGQWRLDDAGKWYYMLERGETIIRRVSRTPQETAIFPLGPKKKSLFHMYKLQYRKGDTVMHSLQSIAVGLLNSEHPNEEFIRIIQNVQWLEPSNSLLFTGTKENLLRVRELIEEIDVPLRQVFIEMLILETSLDDSLLYGVNWGNRFGGGNWAGAQGFTSPAIGINGTANLGQAPALGGLSPNSIMGETGFDIGIIGQKIVETATGIEFSSMSALLHALRTKTNVDVVLNPKIITEDNVPAEIFVGENQAFKSQSIANDQGNTITSNFDFRDVGTRLRVTPLLGNSDIITLEISQERSETIPQAPIVSISQNAPPPNTTKSTTVTRVHMPDGYFLIISGMLNDRTARIKTATPCLGGIPIVGGAFKQKEWLETKRNQMIFIRPQIVDTEEKIQNLTKHQQDIWRFKRNMKKDWLFEQEEAFDFLNLQPSPTVETDPVLEPFDQ